MTVAESFAWQSFQPFNPTNEQTLPWFSILDLLAKNTCDVPFWLFVRWNGLSYSLSPSPSARQSLKSQDHAYEYQNGRISDECSTKAKVQSSGLQNTTQVLPCAVADDVPNRPSHDPFQNVRLTAAHLCSCGVHFVIPEQMSVMKMWRFQAVVLLRLGKEARQKHSIKRRPCQMLDL